jgi:hypothetical protein
MKRSNLDPCEIVSIHFGNTGYYRYESLIRIHKLITVGETFSEEFNNARQFPKKQAKLIKKIEDVKKQITSLKNTYVRS